MRNMLAFSAALLLTVLGVGWYLEWYHFGTTPTVDGHSKVTIDIDTTKIGADLRKANQEVQHKLGEKNHRATHEEASEPQLELFPATKQAPAERKQNWIDDFDKLIDH